MNKCGLNKIQREIITFEWMKALEGRFTVHFTHIQIGVRRTRLLDRQHPNVTASGRFSLQRYEESVNY